MRKVRKGVQLTFEDARKPQGHGGWRPGAGRKKGRTTPAHATRPELSARNPVHVTLRCVACLPTLRRDALVAVLIPLIAKTHREDFSIVEFSVMSNHVHFMIECGGKLALARGMHRFTTRAARVANRYFGREGRVFAERYHARALRTPREVRNALAYVLTNAHHHGYAVGAFDPYSSAAWFDGWATPAPAPERPDPCAPPRTWLLAVGWKRRGLLDVPVPRVAIWNDDLPARAIL